MRVVDHAFDEQAEAALALQQRLAAPPRRSVMSRVILAKPIRPALLVADRLEDGVAPEAAAVLAHAPAFGLVPAVVARLRQGSSPEAGLAWSSAREETREMLADDLVGA